MSFSYLTPNYARLPVKFVRGEGVYLYDTEGKEYIDLISGTLEILRKKIWKVVVERRQREG
jgi:acetylornithine/succinyldiaminopimelate/putrescine aminotransferase